MGSIQYTQPSDGVRDAKGRYVAGHPGRSLGDAKHVLTSSLRELLVGDPAKVVARWRATQEEGRLTGAQRAAVAVLEGIEAQQGSILKEAWNRLEGRVPMPIEHSGMIKGESIKVIEVRAPQLERPDHLALQAAPQPKLTEYNNHYTPTELQPATEPGTAQADDPKPKRKHPPSGFKSITARARDAEALREIEATQAEAYNYKMFHGAKPKRKPKRKDKEKQL